MREEEEEVANEIIHIITLTKSHQKVVFVRKNISINFKTTRYVSIYYRM